MWSALYGPCTIEGFYMFLNELTWVGNSVCSRAHRFKELKREINNILEVKKKHHLSQQMIEQLEQKIF